MSDNAGGEKKLNLITATFLAVGTIIGSGILGTLPNAVSLAGSKTWICIIVAAINVFFSNFVMMIICGVIPANAGPYMYMTRLVHPVMTIFEMVSRLLQFFLLALMGTIFSGYFSTLFPSVNGKVAAVIVLLLFGVLNIFGIDAAAKVGNVLVIMLIIAFMLYSFYGFTVDTSTIPGYVPESSKPLTGVLIGTVSALFVTTLGGGAIVGEVAESMENPEKNIIRAFVLSIVIVVVTYSVMSFATARAAGHEQFDTLSTLAKMIMPTGPFYFFMIGGAMCAITSTINGLIIQTSFYLDRFAQDQILPGVFNKKNSRGVRTLNVVITTLAPIFILLFNMNVFTLLAVSSVLILFTTFIKLIPCLLIEKRYPNAYRKAYVHPKFIWMCVFAAIAAALNLYSGVSTVISTPGPIWGILVGMLVVFAIYFFARRAYLKGQGVDLNEILSTPPQSWIDLENS